jgi:metal-sulfur cluster biosynthetic enzyme
MSSHFHWCKRTVTRRLVGARARAYAQRVPGIPVPVDPAISDVLRGVFDPCCREKGISVVDMGLLQAASIADGVAQVDLVLTTGWCPFASQVLTDVEAAVAALPSVDRAEVRVVWDEAWSPDRLSADARRKLRFLPPPAEVADRASFIAAQRSNGGSP